MTLVMPRDVHPRHAPTNASWWADCPQDPEAWYATARAQVDRMMGSEAAKKMGERASIDDLYLRGTVSKW